MSLIRLKKYQESIYLVGFMASGKSAIGKILAQSLEKPYLDLDDYIVEKEERSIPQIFNDKGEAYFRTQEWKYILEITQNFKGIVSLGGGALHNQKVVDHIKLYGLMVFLNTPLDIILQRIVQNKNRPLVLNQWGEIKSQETLFSELESLYLKREYLYKQAQITLKSTGEETKEEQTSMLIEKLQRYV
jgi:shikimate kinase